jgi:hypothetical protein
VGVRSVVYHGEPPVDWSRGIAQSTLVDRGGGSGTNSTPTETLGEHCLLTAESDRPAMSPTASTRTRALSLYRQLLRGAQKMPTPNRQNFVRLKTQTEFRAGMNLTDPEEIEFHLRVADTSLDTVLVQAEHLTKLFRDQSLQGGA